MLPRGELANAITHGLGLMLSVIGSVYLLSRAAEEADLAQLIGCSVFAVTLVALYTASTLSHSFADPRRRQFFRQLDQACIYLLIVGTYTPFGVPFLYASWWPGFFALMWSLGIAGFVSKMFFGHRVQAVSIGIYVLMGWLPLIPALTLIGTLPSVSLWWMLAGGLCYTIGAVILVYDYLHHHLHAVWHLLVIAGSTCHFFGILSFVSTGIIV